MIMGYLLYIYIYHSSDHYLTLVGGLEHLEYFSTNIGNVMIPTDN